MDEIKSQNLLMKKLQKMRILKGKLDLLKDVFENTDWFENMNELEQAGVLGRIVDVVNTLPIKEQIVIMSRYGLKSGERKTQVQVGKSLRLSGSTIGTYEASALKKLSHGSKAKLIKYGNMDLEGAKLMNSEEFQEFCSAPKTKAETISNEI